MDVIEMLQKKYEATKYDTVTDWMKDNKVELSLQSCTAVLLRGQDKGLVVMLTLAAALHCTPKEMQWIAQQKGDKTLWRLITPSGISAEDEALLKCFNALSIHQKKIIHSLIKEWTNNPHC